MKRSPVLSTLAVLTVALPVLAGTLTGPVAAAPAAADVPAVSVTWPDLVRFNPSVTPYEFTVTDAPADAHLFYTWGYQDYPAWQTFGYPVPESRDVTVDFTDAQGHGAVRVWTCPDAFWSADCVEQARSPEIDAWYEVQVVDEQGTPPWRHSGVQHVSYWYGPKPPLGGTPTGTWELLDADLQPLEPAVTGDLTPADLAFDADTGSSRLTFTIPDGLPSGDYHLDIHMSIATDDFGPLLGSMSGDSPELSDRQQRSMDIEVDNDAPTLTVRKTPLVLYPVTDEYLDYAYVYAKASEYSTATFEVTDSQGKRMYRSTGHLLGPDDFNTYNAPVWNGRKAGKVVPEGRYTMTLTTKDRAGNTASWSTPVKVSHKHLQWTMFKKTVTAAASRTGKPYVGKCATLASPAKGGPKGSLGFYSATKCQGTPAANGVATNHGMYIPRAYKHRYSYEQVILNGGPATGAAGNYIHLAYLRPHSKKLWNGRFLTKGNGAHPGMKLTGDACVFDRSSLRPFIIWTNGLTDGSRYDVRSYTVVVRYLKLR